MVLLCELCHKGGHVRRTLTSCQVFFLACRKPMIRPVEIAHENVRVAAGPVAGCMKGYFFRFKRVGNCNCFIDGPERNFCA